MSAARPRLMVVTGEVSGDIHTAGILHELRKQIPDIEFCGIGGPRCADAGLDSAVDMSEMAVVGLAEVLPKYGFFKRVMNQMVSMAQTEKPDAILLTDYPGFNLRLAQKVAPLNIPTLYYICPQVWAWNRRRIPKMARLLTRLMVIFPFEVDVFKDTQLQVDYVGHPLVGQITSFLETPQATLPWTSGKRVALLPGSRRSEVTRNFPTLLETAHILKKHDPEISIIAAAPDESIARQLTDMSGQQDGIATIVHGQTREILRQATCACVASGTATLETALIGCPAVIAYRVSPLTYFLARMLIRVPYIGMVNLIAEREVCREFIQNAARPQSLADALLERMADGPERNRILEGYSKVREALGPPVGPEKAAGIIAEALKTAPATDS